MKIIITIFLVIVFSTISVSNYLYKPSDSKNYTSKVYNDSLEYDSEHTDFDDNIGYSYIDSYVRSDGTRVSGHYRTDPDEYEENNFSYEGEESNNWDYEYHE